MSLDSFAVSEKKLNTLEISRNPDVIFTELDGESVLMDPAAKYYISLNPVGSACWDALAKKQTFASIIETLLNKYTVEEHICREEVLNFLKELSASDLIRINE